jgi:hypothetical protein
MPRLKGFVLFAEMRTGSNYLEALLASCPGIACHGEVFNPAFLGAPERGHLFGMDLAARNRDPGRLLVRMRRRSDGLAGFRFFHDHDPRVLDEVMGDGRWAKVLLGRDPLDSYVSLKIAVETGQWTLTQPLDRRQARVRVDAAEFDAFAQARAAFRTALERRLQHSGEAAFRLDYADLSDRAVIQGLVTFLGCSGGPDWDRVPLLRQNPEPLADKVLNPESLDEIRARQAVAASVLRSAPPPVSTVRPPPFSDPR